MRLLDKHHHRSPWEDPDDTREVPTVAFTCLQHHTDKNEGDGDRGNSDWNKTNSQQYLSRKDFSLAVLFIASSQ